MSLFTRITNKLKFILSCHHKIGHAISFYDYACLSDTTCEYHLLESNRTSTVKPAQFINEPITESFETNLPDTYWAKLTEGSVIGQSSVVISRDGKILYDMLIHRRTYNANMTDDGLFLLGGSPTHFGNHYIYNYHRQGVSSLSAGISLACNMSSNYYHFMLQVAARFYLLQLTDINKNIPLIIDQSVLSIPQMKEVIAALNIDNRPIISIGKNQLIQVKELYILSEPNVIIPNSFAKGERRTENFAFDKKVLIYLKETLKSRIPTCTETFPKRVFLSRKNCAKRKCNEEELMRLLIPLGFELIETAGLSVAQQIALFSNAECIIGGSGAAFTNLIYCKNGTNAVLFFTGHRNNTCFSSLGSCIGINTYYAYPEIASQVIHVDYYRINPDTIYNHLKNSYTK